MARYDEIFTELQVKLDAALKVIAGHPEIQDELREALAVSPGESVKVDDPTDEARANALAAVLLQAQSAIGIPAPIE